ncbi:hypothetical protein LTR84_011738 [Exophiala bonariae]|uniref:C6 finger domain-containing protein n=1 Tax=Exophiala bonariae TaxID=1690606 RepID=A0AAV9NHW6_9EURO|nr:hypothetical protein LTR84_011738 [Exophiala bonariae]
MTTALGPSPLSHKRLAIDMIAASLQEDRGYQAKFLDVLRFQDYNMDLLEKFQTRTVFCLGTTIATHIFQKEVARLACSHRFLMHLVQAVTACHDRYLAGSSYAEPDPLESYNLNSGLVLYQQKLSQPLRPTDRDALFVAASLTGIASFATFQARTVEDGWPLRDGDLNWLRLSSGKHAVVELIDPSGKESMWKPLIENVAKEYWAHDVNEERCTVFDHLCSPRETLISTIENPYHETIDKLATILALECNEKNWIRLLCFLMHATPGYTSLLQQKDPWALMMLAYWYAKVCQARWWLARRGILEGLAICLYIERNCLEDQKLQEAVTWPKQILESLMAIEQIEYS